MNQSRPKVKRSRALGIPLTRKCVKYFERRPFPPGVHGRARRKTSDYQVRLLEKQRLRHQYNVSESQLRRAYDDAHKGAGKTGETMDLGEGARHHSVRSRRHQLNPGLVVVAAHVLGVGGVEH